MNFILTTYKYLQLGEKYDLLQSYVDIIPGHIHLRELGRIVKEEIRKAGGVPFELNTIGICDGMAMGDTPSVMK